MKNDDWEKESSFDYLGFALRITFPVLVIATGVFFFLAQQDASLYATNWWVMYLIIVGLGMLVGAVVGYSRLEHWAVEMTGLSLFGILLLIVSLVFAIDPTWSFTRDWQIFRGVNWNAIWPFALIVAGLLLLLPAFFRRQQ